MGKTGRMLLTSDTKDNMTYVLLLETYPTPTYFKRTASNLVWGIIGSVKLELFVKRWISGMLQKILLGLK